MNRNAFPDELVQAVWERARVMPEHDPMRWRQDRCGAWIYRDQYGSALTEFGWKIERVAIDGADDTEHLQPFHCANEFDIGAGMVHCRTTADLRHVAPAEHVVEPHNRATSRQKKSRRSS
jgi:hypothetical protein